MSKDKRPYFTMTVGYHHHRKIRGLSDKAFRLHVSLIDDCYEAKSDGELSAKDLNMLGAKPGKELIDAGLVEVHGDGYMLHDYLQHQHSADEIAAMRDKKAVSGTFGAHTRHHEKKGVFEIGCEHCQKARAG